MSSPTLPSLTMSRAEQHLIGRWAGSGKWATTSPRSRRPRMRRASSSNSLREPSQVSAVQALWMLISRNDRFTSATAFTFFVLPSGNVGALVAMGLPFKASPGELGGRHPAVFKLGKDEAALFRGRPHPPFGVLGHWRLRHCRRCCLGRQIRISRSSHRYQNYEIGETIASGATVTLTVEGGGNLWLDQDGGRIQAEPVSRL